jgi:hypothetical protein
MAIVDLAWRHNRDVYEAERRRPRGLDRHSGVGPPALRSETETNIRDFLRASDEVYSSPTRACAADPQQVGTGSNATRRRIQVQM